VDGMADGTTYEIDPDLSAPRSRTQLDIPMSLVHDLVLRQAVVDGRTSTVQLSQRLALSPVLLSPVIEELRELKYLEVRGMDGRDYQLAPTEAGRTQAQDRMQFCRYLGPAPVSLDLYYRMVEKQHRQPAFDLPSLKQAFSDLVISDELLREVGPATMGKGAMFLYGPPGTGKSSIAERMLRVYEDHVVIPHCIEVDGQIISVFDPLVHKPVAKHVHGLDPRWVLCERPCIIVGGELRRDQLDLAQHESSGTYVAPLQMQANNGILVIDDFGRQSLTPQELLNRWIVPLDRQVDYLSLEHGLTFEIPFRTKIVFSTNLDPQTLGDEAFFRRIQSKVLIPAIADDQFDEVLRRVAHAKGVEIAPNAAEHLRWTSRNRGDGDLRPYLPGAVCEILKSICGFERLPPRLDPPMINRIAKMYFTRDVDEAGLDEPTYAGAEASSAPPLALVPPRPTPTAAPAPPAATAPAPAVTAAPAPVAVAPPAPVAVAASV
jgi:hypothetical protein